MHSKSNFRHVDAWLCHGNFAAARVAATNPTQALQKGKRLRKAAPACSFMQTPSSSKFPRFLLPCHSKDSCLIHYASTRITNTLQVQHITQIERASAALQAHSPDFEVGFGGVGIGVFDVVEGECAEQHDYEQHARRPHVHLAPHATATSALTHHQ